MKKMNWKVAGQFFSFLLNLFAIVRDTFAEMKVGIEIVEWLLGEGKEAFREKFLKPLGAEFLATQRVKVVNDTTIMVNLDAPPKLPFDNAKIEKNSGGGWVKVEKREGELYVDDYRVVLHLSEQQKNSRMSGHELRKELSGKPVLHPNILDALLEYPDLIPEDWKKDEDRYIYIFFWAVIFRSSDGNLCVRCLYFSGGQWNGGCYWLGRDWVGINPAVLLAS